MKTPITRLWLLLTFIIGLTLKMNAQSTNVQFVITTIDGVDQTYTLTNENHVWFENGTTLNFEVGDIIIEYALSDIRKITCNEIEGTNENKETALSVFPNPVHDIMMLRNLDGTQTVRIYAIDGHLVKSTETDGSQPIDISSLSLGIYLVKIQSQTLKMIKL